MGGQAERAAGAAAGLTQVNGRHARRGYAGRRACGRSGQGPPRAPFRA